ncbi:DUF1795 domain-containing protein [Paracoccus aminophilus]|uniref:DUF1795 domain-containing protein n=1 Tax=Paracoccus aminophilus JCM 7686 TaxID=1367847 RepID=S5XRG8_PARAH|nr:DUF1795 domain-containing protein [Paracoccus aminophilus]AGT10004.1 hypothetical protein JCM7686_2968 [Paracoccus aminophilus JCM 7686]
MFVFNEGTLDLPDSWKDQTINVISSTAAMEPGLTVSITRDTLPWGMGFSEYVEDQIKQIEDALDEFKLMGRKPATLSRAAAYEIECSWKAKQGPIHQIITTIQLADNRAMVITASVPGAMTPSQQTEVRRIVSTLNLQPRRS